MKKRLICALCALVSAVCLTAGVLAAETYSNFAQLYEQWSMTQMPDWVCSVVSADGKSERLAVVVSSQEAAEELKSMLEDPSSVEIIVAEGSYSYNELLRVQEEIAQEHMGAEGKSPVVSVGTGFALIDGEVVGFGESGKELRVVVGVLPEQAEKYRSRLQKKYGDMVYVEVSEGAFITDGGLRESEPVQFGGYLVGGAVLLAAAAAAVVWSRRKNPARGKME